MPDTKIILDWFWLVATGFGAVLGVLVGKRRQ